jgi:hypothetical protein
MDGETPRQFGFEVVAQHLGAGDLVVDHQDGGALHLWRLPCHGFAPASVSPQRDTFIMARHGTAWHGDDAA